MKSVVSYRQYAFKSLYPWRSQVLEHALETYLEAHEQEHETIVQQVTDTLAVSIPNVSVFMWDKNLFRMYEQCKREGMTFHQQCGLLKSVLKV